MSPNLLYKKVQSCRRDSRLGRTEGGIGGVVPPGSFQYIKQYLEIFIVGLVVVCGHS